MDQLERFMNENKGDLEYEELFTEMYVELNISMKMTKVFLNYNRYFTAFYKRLSLCVSSGG